VIEQHRRPRVADLPAQFPDVLDRIADLQPDAGARATATASSAQPRATRQASRSCITSPIVIPVRQQVPEKVTFMISFSHTMRRRSSNRATLKPADSQIAAEACETRARQPGIAAEAHHLHAVVVRVARRAQRRAEAADHAHRERSGPTIGATRSAEPRPFWIVCTTSPASAAAARNAPPPRRRRPWWR
jgi:hypothetical protein